LARVAQRHDKDAEISLRVAHCHGAAMPPVDLCAFAWGKGQAQVGFRWAWPNFGRARSVRPSSYW
jgi:hypothetical protein